MSLIAKKCHVVVSLVCNETVLWVWHSLTVERRDPRCVKYGVLYLSKTVRLMQIVSSVVQTIKHIYIIKFYVSMK